jgi:hypothetical protein
MVVSFFKPKRKRKRERTGRATFEAYLQKYTSFLQ